MFFLDNSFLASIFLVSSVIFAIFFLVLIFLKKIKEGSFFNRGMNLALFLVTLPQTTIKEKEISLEDYLKSAEQFYFTLAGLKERNKFLKFLIGDPFIAFEIAVHRIGEEIYFYVACPRPFAGMIEKEILGFWPKAQVQPVNDYNIFNPRGTSTGTRAYLLKSPVLPLKTYQDFKTDPLSSITSLLTKLKKEGEGAAIQILIRPSRKPIGKMGLKTTELMQQGTKLEGALAQSRKGFLGETFEAFSKGSKSKDEDQVFKRPELTPFQQETIAAISRKSSQPLFDVNLRIISSASEEARAKIILEELKNAFEQFNSPFLNKIQFKKLSKGALKKLFYNFSFRIFNEAEVMVLSPQELVSIFHFPSQGLLTPHVKWLKAKQAPPPENLPEEGFIVGKNVFRGEERTVRFLKDDRRRHFYIVGQTGTGKSTLLQEMIRQDMEAGEGVALIDPHGDLAEKLLTVIPSSRIEDVIYFNPADPERAIGLNMLEYNPEFPESKTFVVNELLEIFEKLYNLQVHGFGGPVFEQYMRNSLLLVMEDPESGSTLIEVPRVLADADFRKYKLSRCKNIVVKNFWEKEAEKAGGEAALANMVPYITSKMNIFIANDMVRPIIAQQKSAFDFRQIMDEGKILLINLSKGKLGDINSYLLGMIIVGKLLMAALSRVDIEEEKRRDFYLYIDEFQNVTTKTINTVLSEARKYRLALILSHQFIGQLEEDTRKAVFGNIGTILAFRVGPEDAKQLLTQFEPTFDENDLVNFDNFNAAFRLLIRGETSKPFNIVTFPPKKGEPEVARLIKEFSRNKYGKSRALVEAELSERLQKRY